MPFNDLPLLQELLTALDKLALLEPTPIQTLAFPVISAGSDAYLHAETGSGKTLAYLLPIYSRLRFESPATQVIRTHVIWIFRGVLHHRATTPAIGK